MTSDELALLISHPHYIKTTWNVSNDAISTTATNFPNNHEDDSIGNAFQHFYWTLSLIVQTDKSFGYEFVVAYENYSDNDSYSKSMDLQNNLSAYTYYKTNKTNNSITYSKSFIVSLGKKYVSNGYLIYILRNYKYVYQIIYDVYTKKRNKLLQNWHIFCSYKFNNTL